MALTPTPIYGHDMYGNELKTPDAAIDNYCERFMRMFDGMNYGDVSVSDLLTEAALSCGEIITAVEYDATETVQNYKRCEAFVQISGKEENENPLFLRLAATKTGNDPDIHVKVVESEPKVFFKEMQNVLDNPTALDGAKQSVIIKCSEKDQKDILKNAEPKKLGKLWEAYER